jgi:polysaccharide deacetylase 2 family uncharacterized protein YibQ
MDASPAAPTNRPPGVEASQKNGADASPPDDNARLAARALTDPLQPYEEEHADTLEQRIRRVDYALTQAVFFMKLPASHLRLAMVENRSHGAQFYHFQVVEILPGKSTRPFIAALRQTLRAWAELAALSRIRENRWAISVDGVQTHVLQLYPGQGSFPEDGSVSPPEHASPSIRSPGEPARLVIVIDDLGAGLSPVHQLLDLDFPVTLSFWPHAQNTREGARAAHQAGREILVHQPMEPVGYPRVQPGPGGLRVGMDAQRIRGQLEENIAKVPYAVGMNNHMGSRFTQEAGGIDAVLEVLRDKGMFMLDSVTHPQSVFYKQARRLGVAAYQRNVFLDAAPTRENVLEELERAQRVALQSGQAIAIGHPLPDTLAALKEWQQLRDPAVRIVRLRDLPRPGGEQGWAGSLR